MNERNTKAKGNKTELNKVINRKTSGQMIKFVI